MSCAAELALSDQTDAATIKSLLAKYHFLTDANHTIPPNGYLLTLIFKFVQDSDVIEGKVIRQEMGGKILELARKAGDPRIRNLALLYGPEGQPGEIIKLEREGWKSTGDPRFAAAVLLLKQHQGQLASKDEELAEALKQFPENGLIQRIGYEVANSEKKVTKQMLAAAAAAEFGHFSSSTSAFAVLSRPRSDYLRQYFAELQTMKGH